MGHCNVKNCQEMSKRPAKFFVQPYGGLSGDSRQARVCLNKSDAKSPGETVGSIWYS